MTATVGALALGCPPLGNNDHVMPGDIPFIVRRCARAACGDDVIIYDIGNQGSHKLRLFQIVRFSNTMNVIRTDITKSVEIFRFPWLAKYRLYLTYIAKCTQMSCSLACFFAGRHCHLYHFLRDARSCGSASWSPRRHGSCDRKLPTYFSPASQMLHLPGVFCRYYHVRILRICFGQILGLITK